MKSILRYINLLLSILPFNGYKTIVGVVIVIVAKLVQKEVPSVEDLQALLDALADLGISVAAIGGVHKISKLVE